jgi:hypothetical protein
MSLGNACGFTLHERGGAFARERERRDLRESARHRGLAGARGSREHDEPVRQPESIDSRRPC